MKILRSSTWLCASILLAGSAAPLFADFTYNETSQMTGGALLSMMKIAGAFAPKGQKPTDATQTTVAVRGNRMVRKSAQEATVIDLDKQTITTVHFAKKTYSVMTFAQMRQMLEQMSSQMKDSADKQQVKMSFDVHVTNTGQTKTIAGSAAHEMIVTLAFSGTDPSTGQTGAMNMVCDMWVSPDVNGYNEVLDFNKRMAEEIGWVPGSNSMLGRPDIAKAMAGIYKDSSQLQGLPLENVVKIGLGPGQPTLTSDQQKSLDDAAQQVAATQQTAAQPETQPQTPQNTQNSSTTGAIANALGQHFGFGHHKKPAADSANSNSSNNSAPNSGSTPPPTSNSSSPGSLMEITQQVTNYQAGGVDASWFDIPSGFSEIQENLMVPPRHR